MKQFSFQYEHLCILLRNSLQFWRFVVPNDFFLESVKWPIRNLLDAFVVHAQSSLDRASVLKMSIFPERESTLDLHIIKTLFIDFKLSKNPVFL